jgi:hypothetical protein
MILRSHIATLLAFFSGVAHSTLAWADAPPPPSKAFEFYCSLNKQYCVKTDSMAQATMAYAARNGKPVGTPLWTVKRRIEYGEISNNGKSLAVVESGNCLTSRQPSSRTRFVTFYVNGQETGAIRAGDLFATPQQLKLPATSSNYQWCSSFGLTGNDRFEVNMPDGRRLLFAPSTAALLNR